MALLHTRCQHTDAMSYPVMMAGHSRSHSSHASLGVRGCTVQGCGSRSPAGCSERRSPAATRRVMTRPLGACTEGTAASDASQPDAW